MANLIYRVVSACGALGYGFPKESLEEALKGRIDAVISDAGSMDAGPYYLGTGEEYFERDAVKQDFRHMVEAVLKTGAPLILGSSGMAGGDRNVEFMLDVAKEVFAELNVIDAKVAVIGAELDPEIVVKEFKNGALRPTGAGTGTQRGGAAGERHRRPDGHPSADHGAGKRGAVCSGRAVLRHRPLRLRHDPSGHRRRPRLPRRSRSGVRRPGLRPRVTVRLPGGGDLRRRHCALRGAEPRSPMHAPIRSPPTHCTKRATPSCSSTRRAFSSWRRPSSSPRTRARREYAAASSCGHRSRGLGASSSRARGALAAERFR